MRHDEPAIGLWVACDSNMEWSGDSFFSSREECLAHAEAELDHPFYVARIAFVVTDEVAAGFLLRDDDEAEECLVDAHDLAADDHLLDISSEARREMLAAVAAILRERGCVTSWYQVNGVERICGPIDAEKGGTKP